MDYWVKHTLQTTTTQQNFTISPMRLNNDQLTSLVSFQLRHSESRHTADDNLGDPLQMLSVERFARPR